MAKAEGWPKQRRILGTRVKRLDGPAKATGRAKYSYDINRKGMLHGKILRSPYAHAKIKSIDTSAARKTPGFKTLLVIGVAKNGTVVSIEGDKLTYKPAAAGPANPNAPKDLANVVLQVTPAVMLIAKNKIVKLSDLK